MEKNEPTQRPGSTSHHTERTRRVVALLWASFLIAAVGEFVFFAVFDPADLQPMGWQMEPASRLFVYTIMFFFFWMLAAASAAVATFLQRTPGQVNRRADRGVSKI